MDNKLADLGAPMTPKELADLLKLDPRTVKKYHHRWGGVEVAPGVIRFFENRVKDILDQAMQEETPPLRSLRPGPRPAPKQMKAKSREGFNKPKTKDQKDVNRHGLFTDRQKGKG